MDNEILTRDEWVKRAMVAGAPSEDYADSLYLSYTDDGVSEMTPEQIIAEDKMWVKRYTVRGTGS